MCFYAWLLQYRTVGLKRWFRRTFVGVVFPVTAPVFGQDVVECGEFCLCFEWCESFRFLEKEFLVFVLEIRKEFCDRSSVSMNFEYCLLGLKDTASIILESGLVELYILYITSIKTVIMITSIERLKHLSKMTYNGDFFGWF